MNYPQLARGWILDLLFPSRCLFCGQYGEYVCRECFKLTAVKKNFECIGCERPVSYGQTCFNCRKNYFVDNLWVASDYKDPKIQKMIKTLKYRFVEDMSKPIYSLIEKYLRRLSSTGCLDSTLGATPLVMPIPLTRYRLNWRGFNQAELIAGELKENMGWELLAGSIVRDHAKPQADLESRKDRENNMIGKFKFIGSNLEGRNVLLVDDVCTTGSTLNECAKVLKQNGAGKIIALVIARG